MLSSIITIMFAIVSWARALPYDSEIISYTGNTELTHAPAC